MKRAQRILSQTWIPAVAGLLLLLLATSPPAFGANNGHEGSLAVEGVEASGNAVEVAVSNSDDEARVGTVTVAAKVEGNLVVKSASVSLAAGSVATVRLSYRSPIEDVITVGIQDGQNPF